MIRLDDSTLRHLAAALGAGAAVFGLAPVVAPRAFARAFGLPADGGPGALAAIRSVGVRDAVTGVGLCSAALHGGKYAPWLLSRALADAADALIVGLAVAQGGGNARMRTLALLALSAAAVDALLWRAAKHAAQPASADLDLDEF